MHIIQRLIIFLAPVAWIVGLELMKKFSTLWWAAVLLIFLFIFFAVWHSSKQQFNKIFLNFLILPLALAFSGFSLALFIANALFFHIFAVLTAFLLYVLLWQYFLYFNLPYKYQPYSLEGLSWCIGLISGYFVFASCFGGLILLKFNIWIILPVLLIVSAFITYQFFWINKIDFDKNWLAVLIVILVLAELFYAISCLPTSYFVNAFVLTVSFYLMLGLGKLYFLNALTQKKVFTYFIVAGLALLAIFVTAQWA